MARLGEKVGPPGRRGRGVEQPHVDRQRRPDHEDRRRLLVRVRVRRRARLAVPRAPRGRESARWRVGTTAAPAVRRRENDQPPSFFAHRVLPSPRKLPRGRPAASPRTPRTKRSRSAFARVLREDDGHAHEARGVGGEVHQRPREPQEPPPFDVEEPPAVGEFRIRIVAHFPQKEERHQQNDGKRDAW